MEGKKDEIMKDAVKAQAEVSSNASRCLAQASRLGEEEQGMPLHRKVHCSYKIYPVAEMFRKMTGQKKHLLVAMSFGGLMSLPMIENNAVKSVNRQLGFWLLMQFDGKTGVLDLGTRGKIPITEQDVTLVTGLQSVGRELSVSDQSKIETIKERIKTILMLDGVDVLDLENIRRVLERDLAEDSGHFEQNAFIVAAAIYAVSYFLAPKGRPPRINTEILEELQDPANVFRINWASYVLRNLKDCSNKVKSDVQAQCKTVTLEGCLLILQIAYLDNLNFGKFSTTHAVAPRIISFNKELMDKLTNMDKIHRAATQDCKFGKTEIRNASESIYSWGCGSIDTLRAKSQKTEIEELLHHLENCNDDHIKDLRNKHRLFEEQQLIEAKKHHDQVKKMVKRLGQSISIIMGNNSQQGDEGIVNIRDSEEAQIAVNLLLLDKQTTTREHMLQLCALENNQNDEHCPTHFVASSKRKAKRKRDHA